MRREYYFFLCFIFLVKVYSQSSEELLHFNSIKDGISQTGIHFINQDNEGFVWIGTHGSGLYRYDGINYNAYRPKVQNSHKRNSSFVFCSYVDYKNNLWVGTNLGLALYDREKDEFNHVPFITKDGRPLGNVGISSLHGDEKGQLYLGTTYRGIFLFDLEDFKVDELSLANGDPNAFLAINDIKKSDDGTLYAASSSGLLAVNQQAKVLDLALLRNGKKAETITTPLESLLIDKNNTLWVGTIHKGIYRVQMGNEEEGPSVKNYKITANNIFSLSEAPGKGVLLGTENDGLYHVDNEGHIIHHYLFDKTDENSILSNSIWALYKDQNERLWMGYYNKGVAVHDKYYNKFNSIKSVYNKTNSLQTSSVTSIESDKDHNLWIAMEGGGIDVVDPKTNQFTHINSFKKSDYQGLTSDYIQTLFIDSRNNIWVGSWDKGIFLLKNGSGRFVNYRFPIRLERKGSSAVMSFTEDARGRVWISTFNQGLYSYDLNKMEEEETFSESSFEFKGLEGQYINKLEVGENNTIWVATTNQLLKLEEQSDGTYKSQNLNTVLAGEDSDPYAYYSFDIVSLYKEKEGDVWIGTRGLGAVRYDVKNNRAYWYDQNNGLDMPNINGIIEGENGHIWFSGNSGLVLLDKATEKFTQFSKNDGLLSRDYNKNAIYKDPDGNLYFGGTEGIDYFNPHQIDVLETPPTVYLKNLKLFNEDVTSDSEDSPLTKALSQTDSITFTSKQSVFTIEFSGINYTRPEENTYAYYLEGYEEDYNYVGNSRSATYTNLDTGRYVFKVKAANIDGFWNETPTTLFIEVLPPWWKTPWAILIYTLVFLGLLALWIQFEKNRLLQRQQVENERKERERKELLHEERIQFFTNVAHEFSSPLTLIINPIKDLLSNSTNLPDRVQKKHLTIFKNADRLYRLINELLDFSKLESNKVKINASRFAVVPFIKKLIGYFEEESQSNDIQLILEEPIDEIWIWADKGMLEKIVFNLLSNAFKVTPQGGSIKLKLQQQSDHLELVVSDTGIGLEEKELKKLFHRYYQAKPINNGFFSGTGIGLQLVHSFVNLHGGEISVNSEKGSGTSFTVILPLNNKDLKSSTKSPRENILSEKNLPINNLSTVDMVAPQTEKQANLKTLLIVEDDTELRNYLKSEFRAYYKCVVAKNGGEGIQMAIEILPDVIITDVLMPEMSGYDLCEAIRKDIRTSHIPIMMLTAKSGADERIKGIDKGADVYLNKPFDMNLVLKHLKQMVQSREVIYNRFLRSMGDVKEDITITSLDKLFIERAMNFIQDNLTNSNLGVESLAEHLNLSRSQLYRKIKGLTNQTANEFIRNQRLQKARKLLEKGNTDLHDICSRVGFSSTTYFTQRFRDYYGVSPNEVTKTSAAKG